jgi:enoyl-CoA hydratase/carnithine racemase
VGIRRAKEIILTGRPFSAEQALDWGMVNEVCEAADLLAEARKTATVIAGNGPIAVREAKRAMNHAAHGDLKAGYRIEPGAYSKVVPTADRREGILAFNEKRKPQFKGEERQGRPDHTNGTGRGLPGDPGGGPAYL